VAVARRCPQRQSVQAPGVRQATSGFRASGQPVPAGCVDLAHVTSADEQAQRAQRCHRAATAAAGPSQSCRSRPGTRTPRPVSGWKRNRTPRTPWLSAAASGTAVAVRGLVSGRLVSGRGVRRGHFRSLWVSAATGTGRPVGGRWADAATAGTRG
jgi:hypothetical protein